jgi:CHAT domain-containing protein
MVAFRRIGAVRTLIIGASTLLLASCSAPKQREGSSPWDAKWQQVQRTPDAVALGDHWRVCEIKFRFRNYQELFRCLELMEQRVAKLDEKAPQRRYAPVLVGWMRASAYAELGDNQKAVEWADLAWATLPDDYHKVSSRVFECQIGLALLCGGEEKDFAGVAIDAGGSKWRNWVGSADPKLLDIGVNNPAALDMRPQMIAMTLAAERSVLHFQLGERELADRALNDLEFWRDVGYWYTDGNIFRVMAVSLMIGPAYAMSDYAKVVKLYEVSNRERGNPFKFGAVIANLYIALTDERRFATALEAMSDRLLYASSLARAGETDKARQNLDEMLKDPEIRDMGNLYWATLYERGRLALGQGQKQEARQYLQDAVEAIERVRNTVTFEAGKIGFATTKQAVYAALVRALAQSGDWGGAFTAAERAKARALVDLLAQIRDLAPPTTADDKVRQLLASATVNDGMIGFPVDSETVGRRDIVMAARSELPQAAPEAASLVSVQTAALGDIAAKLAPGETLIDYFIAGDDLYAFLVKGAAVKGIKLRGDGLEEEVRAFRKAIETGDDAGADERGRALYDRLIRPLAGEFPSSRLTISAHGVLHYLPFAALRDGDHYLIDRYSLRVTPSASALVYLRTDTPVKPGRVLAFGNPDLGDARYDLPNAQQEALQIAQLFPDSRALVRQEASKTAVKQLGSSFAILHFASHAQFDPDAPLNSGLYLAKGDEVDGRLTVGDLYSMRLDVQLVTLSACQTGLGRVLSGDEVVGLTRGFLYAGARSIVASLWSVDDTATAELMVRFYTNLANHDERESLRLAQIETRNTHPRPIYWAAFEITGSAH